MFRGLKSTFKAFFGKDESGPWRQFAEQVGGAFHFAMGEYHVTVNHKGFDVRLSSYTHYSTAGNTTYESDYTVGRLFFVSRDGFELLLTKEGWIEKLGKLFGLRELQIHSDEFDRKYLVRSEDETKTRLLLATPNIMESILQLKLLRLQISDQEGLFGEKPPSEEHMIYAVLHWKVTTPGEMNELLELFKLLIDALIRNGTMRSPVK